MPKAEGMIQIEVLNAKELQKKFAQSPEHMFIAMNHAFRQAGALLTPQIKEETPVGASHKLRNTTVYQVLGKAVDMRMEIRQSAFSDKGFPYGVAVRAGSRPHFPPYEALIPWVRAKLHVAEERVRSVAFLVARKISRVGTKANPYHIRVFDRNVDHLKDIMKGACLEFVARIADIPEVRP